VTSRRRGKTNNMRRSKYKGAEKERSHKNKGECTNIETIVDKGCCMMPFAS